MKIGLQTWGSHGDIRPFVALADGLQAAGHEVTLVLTCVDSDRYRSLAATTGFKVRMVATPVIADPRLLEHFGTAFIRQRNAIKQTQMVVEHLLLPAEAEMFAAADRLCAENDLVVGHYFHYPLSAAAERHRRPWVSLSLAHFALPSAFRPPLGVPDLGVFGNRMAWRLARWVANRRLKKYADRLRARNGIAPAHDMIDEVWASKYLTLIAVSPTLCERKPDWPGHVRVCGCLDTQAAVAEGSIPEPLEAFLSDGSRPICMTFGSMLSGSDERRTIELLTDAARAASVRAIIQAPHGRELGFTSNDRIFYLGSAPHAVLFPRCELVVHHGGAGTTQAALRAGRPSVVVAHIAEQEIWGRELERAGVAGKPLLRRHASAARIGDAITGVIRSTHNLERAKALGAVLAREDGVATAVRMIGERFAG